MGLIEKSEKLLKKLLQRNKLNFYYFQQLTPNVSKFNL
jgi:hypothetical protein